MFFCRFNRGFVLPRKTMKHLSPTVRLMLFCGVFLLQPCLEPEYTNVKCICNQPFDSDKGMIDCSVCQEWYEKCNTCSKSSRFYLFRSHWECIGAKNEAQAKSLSPWTCGKCKEKAAV